MNPAIEAKSLRKTYGSVTAIDDLSLTIHSGEIFGLLGPNGAGKSTTLRILITVLKPTSGTATVLGHDVVEEADTVRSLIGYVPQERAIDRFLTGREHLELLGDLYHLPKAHAQERIKELLKLVDLEEQADRAAKTYSGGMKRKLDIACGLLPNPKIVFLDEPTLGLDVQSRLRIWDYIRQLREQGITIVMTTNYLEEADQLCDRLAIIDGGKIKVIGSPKELKAGLGGDRLILTVKESQLEKLDQLSEGVKPLPYVRDIRKIDNGLDIRVESPEKSLPGVLEVANRIDCQIDGIEYHRPRLDDVFVSFTGHAIKGEYPEVVVEE
ncbi:MAG: ATP-binding cassette domain-containing protein [Nitrospirae bacterium]|nr:ATP-binding cassette domain-containing protein [Nitrospirota bacterium]MDA1304941.1 ATP-binding cassette domain-containing protein [Nitrospirota bacterium]